MRVRIRRAEALWLSLAACMMGHGLALAAPTPSASSAEDEMSAMRKSSAQRQRRIIFNNDGNDAVHFPSRLEPTDQNLLSVRATPLIHSQVDTLSYCTNRGIGLVLHQSMINEVLTGETRDKTGAYADKRNIVGDLARRGTDPLKVMVAFCRQHQKEIFWSMRMNDIHDASNSAMLSRFKRENSPLLFGAPAKPPPFRGYSGLWGATGGATWGGYSGVDYGQQAVRDLVFRTVEEVCRNYEVDGVELDFLRSPVLFKSHAWNGEATDEERRALTDLVTRIRKMADDVGRKRGRALLLAVRVPDSIPYCFSIGIDLEKWLRNDLLDLMIPGGDFLLNPWESTVNLGHQHGVRVYPCVNRAPTSANPGYEERAALECYRGRALRAWNAGADGVFVFNVFDAGHAMLKELGDPKAMLQKSRIYYGSEMPTWHARVNHPRGMDFRSLPLLSPEHPQELQPGKKMTTPLHVPEDPHSLAGAEIILAVKVRDGNRADAPLNVLLNGHELTKKKIHEAWLEFEVQAEWVTRGDNEVAMVSPSARVITDIRVTVSPPNHGNS